MASKGKKDHRSSGSGPMMKLRQTFDESMPAIPSVPADTFCLALYALTDGRMKRRIKVSTVAHRLGVSCDEADAMLTEADAAGLVHHKARTVALTHKGQAFADTLERVSRCPRAPAQRRVEMFECLKALMEIKGGAREDGPRRPSP